MTDKSKNDYAAALLAELAEDVRRKWSAFTKQLEFKDTVPLADRIEMFAIPWLEYARTRAPSAPPFVLWAALFDGVRRSQLHSDSEVSAAVARLGEKYGKPSSKVEMPLPSTSQKPRDEFSQFLIDNADWALSAIATPILAFITGHLKWRYDGPVFGYHADWLDLLGLWLVCYWLVRLVRKFWKAGQVR